LYRLARLDSVGLHEVDDQDASPSDRGQARTREAPFGAGAHPQRAGPRGRPPRARRSQRRCPGRRTGRSWRALDSGTGL
jgi:hypothetical protein